MLRKIGQSIKYPIDIVVRNNTAPSLAASAVADALADAFDNHSKITQ